MVGFIELSILGGVEPTVTVAEMVLDEADVALFAGSFLLTSRLVVDLLENLALSLDLEFSSTYKSEYL